MRPDTRRYKEIARRSTAKSRFAFSPQTDAFAGIGAGWNVDPNRFRAHDATAAIAGGAWVTGQLSAARTARAGLAKLQRPLAMDTLPLPPHCGQLVGTVPTFVPEPRQVSQDTGRSSVMVV